MLTQYTEVARLHARGLVQLAGTGDVEDNLRELAQRAITFLRGVVPMIAAMLDDAETMHGRARAIDAQGHGPRSVLRAVVAYLRREQELGRIAEDAALDGAAMSLIGGCLQQALLAHVWGEDLLLLDDDPAARAIARAVCRGLDPGRRSEDVNHHVG